MKRREFIFLLSSMAAAQTLAPLTPRAQQSEMLVVGILDGGSPSSVFRVALADGLKESGFTEGENVRIEYRSACGAYDLLSKMADELVSLPVNIIATNGTPAVRAARAASLKVSPPVPVVFALEAVSKGVEWLELT